MTQKTSHQKTTGRQEQARREWMEAVEAIVDEAQQWCEEQNWWVHRDQKTITEESLGTYQVPILTIQTRTGGRLIFEPMFRDVTGANGVVDFKVFPTYDRILIVRTDDGWRFTSIEERPMNRRWSKRNFLKLADELMARA